MKKAVHYLLTAAVTFSSAWTQAKPVPSLNKFTKESSSKGLLNGLSPSEKESVINRSSFILRHQVASEMELFFTNKDKEVLKDLLVGWSTEDQAEIRRDLNSVQGKVEFEVVGDSLLMKNGKDQLDLKVINPFEGKFAINGKPVVFDSYRKYKTVVDQIQKLQAISSNQHRPIWMEVVMPEAHAQLGAFLSKIAVTAGAAIVKKAPAVGKSVLVGTANAVKWTAKETGKAVVNTTLGTAGTLVTACVFFGGWFGKVDCIEKYHSVMCDNGKKDHCVTKPSDVVPAQIEEAKKNDDLLLPFAKPVNKNRCEKKGNAFSKQVRILNIDANALEAAEKAGEDWPKAESRSEVTLEYQANPDDPKNLIPAKMVEIQKDKAGKVIGQRNWTFKGEDFRVEYHDPTPLGKLQGKPPVVTECKKSEKKDECVKLLKMVMAPMQNLLNCNVENSDQVIEEIKDSKTGKAVKATK